MHRFRYVIKYMYAIICLSFLCSCVVFPFVFPTSSPNTSIETVLPKSFLNLANEKYLVVPLWANYPYIEYLESEQRPKPEISVGKGFFVRNDEIADLHKKIPRKLKIGIVSNLVAASRIMELYAVLLISESNDSVIVKISEDNDDVGILDAKWGECYPVYINDSDRQTLKRMFDTNEFDKITFKKIFKHENNKILY